MAPALTLLDDVRWRGVVVAGGRPRALLAALATARGRAVRDEQLIELIWGDAPPVNAAKTLQVLVSRTRAACGADAIMREEAGYRLGVEPDEVDSVRLGSLVRHARAALDGDAATAVRLAREALELSGALPSVLDEDGDGALEEIRQEAAADAALARSVLAQALSRVGAHAEALPGLEAAHALAPDDEPLLADLLRSEARVRGPGSALERFERHRRDLRERLGASPGEQLRQMHAELLALDRPVRSGIRFDATSLLGRDRDIEALQGLVANARVVSIVGPGGLGKTRLAHVLAREATQPLVHLVELAGVTTADDLVAEIGSALGVRDSASSRRSLTAAQRKDLRARIAQRLAQSPSLLVLDNCEHLVDAVADLVGFLVFATADLRVLTTSRAPLAIAAERVYLLGELGADDAASLFCERAVSARPDVELDDAVVRRIVVQLDGLPLAIELAAAKVRAMSVEEIERRLVDRFALLRGGDRSAPDRHQTLLAVIDWSWNLLGAAERRALRRLALFNDGFALEGADAVLGAGALEAVQGLVDQSLLSVRELPGGVRYRMLETVREFGRMQLAETGDEADARAARRSWATAFARGQAGRLVGTEQLAAIDAVKVEEINLADELRDAIADGDVGGLVELLATLGLFWTMRGEHGRLLVLAAAIAGAVDGWSPPPELEDVARAAMAITLTNLMMTSDEFSRPIRDLLTRLGPGNDDARIAGMIRVLLTPDGSDSDGLDGRLERLAATSDRHVAQTAGLWLSHVRENAGDPARAIQAAERALAVAGSAEGPWVTAMLHTQLAQLTMHLGDREAAVEHARAGLPVMQRLGAKDDEVQLRSLLVLCAIADGRLADAEDELEQMSGIEEGDLFGGTAIQAIGRAELALARGDHASGLLAYRVCAARMRELRLPGIPSTGRELWVLVGTASALAAHAHHATGADEAHGWSLFATCRASTLRALDPTDPHLDFPVAGLALFALGAWGLLREATGVDTAVRLLVLANLFAYNRSAPTLAWERIVPLAEERATGLVAALLQEYGDRPSRELLGEARDLVQGLAAAD